MTLTGIAIGFLFIATANGAPALYTALAGELAQGSGLELMQVLMIQVVGYSTLLLPYQAPPIVMTMGLAGIGLKDATKLTLAVGLSSLAVATPLAFLWFRATGWLP